MSNVSLSVIPVLRRDSCVITLWRTRTRGIFLWMSHSLRMYLTFLIKGKQSVIHALFRGRMERLWRPHRRPKRKRPCISDEVVLFIRKNTKVIPSGGSKGVLQNVWETKEESSIYGTNDLTSIAFFGRSRYSSFPSYWISFYPILRERLAIPNTIRNPRCVRPLNRSLWIKSR